MKRILYNGGTIDTGDEIADAILAYAEQLAKHGSSDTVDVPIVEEEGLSGRAQLLLGPASQLVVEDLLSTESEPTDAGAIADMDRKRLGLEGPRPVPDARDDFPDLDLE